MRWLHISDIHVDITARNGKVETYRRHFLNGLNDELQQQQPLDCIIFTGDLFNQGKWTQVQIASALNFLKEIYQIGSDTGGWSWQKDMPMTRLFYCPGNHDVLRDAYLIDDAGTVTHRREALEAGQENGFFSPRGTDYKLLTEDSFGLFESIMSRVVPKHCYQSAYPFEFKRFQVPPDVKGPTISVIGINTVLLAGRVYPKEQVSKELEETYSHFLQADARFDTVIALEEYKKYHAAALKKLGYLMNDERNLCFISQQAQEELDNLLYNCRVPIIFGHHPLSFLSNEAMEQFENFADKHTVSIYLCGHTHRASGTLIYDAPAPFWEIETRNHVYQITVGGIFLDSSNYNQASFAIGQVDLSSGTTEANLEVTVFIFAPDIFGDEHMSSYSQKAKVGVKRAPQATPQVEAPIPSTTETHTGNPEIPDEDGKTVQLQKENSENLDDNDLRSRVLLLIDKKERR